MRRAQLKVLEDLVMIPSPSGFEREIAQYIIANLKDLPVQVSQDREYNVSVVVPGKTDKVVMIDAHSDQLGFIIHNIDKNGLLSMSQLGWGDTQLASARDLVIHGERGKIHATVNRQHSHLVEDEDDVRLLHMSEAIVDIGTRDMAEAERHVSIGDPITYPLSFNKMLNHCYSAAGMDDKAGCWILLQTIRRIAKGRMKPKPTLVFTFSAQEESCSKWGPLIRKHKPDLFVEVDSTFATDWSYDDELQYISGNCLLGRGPVIYRGLGIDKEYGRLAHNVASENKFHFQTLAVAEAETEINNAREGTPMIGIGIPLRNMHTPVEIISTIDLDLTVKILHKFLLSRKLA